MLLNWCKMRDFLKREIGFWLLIVVLVVGSMALGRVAHADDHVYSKSEVMEAVKDLPMSCRVVHPKVVHDVTPKTMCDEAASSVDGIGHQETSICPDGHKSVRDMMVQEGKKKVFWKGNPDIGYYRMREDGSIDTSHWKSSINSDESPKSGDIASGSAA